MAPSNRRHGLRQRGMALVAVLWITAALALVAMSLSHMTRTEIRVVQVFKQMTQARAEADGALQVASSWLMRHTDKVKGIYRLTVPIAGTKVLVRIVPVTGLIDINHADRGLLRNLFEFGAGLPHDKADVLAQRVIDWRDEDDKPQPAGAEKAAYLAAGHAPPRNGPFRTPDDLRQVLGVTPDIYARVSDLIVAHNTIYQSTVDPAAAPRGVLRVLSGGKQDVVARMLQERQQESQQKSRHVDYTGLNPKYVSQSGGYAYKLEAMVASGAGHVWRRACWVDLSLQHRGVTPWYIWQIEPLRSATLD